MRVPGDLGSFDALCADVGTVYLAIGENIRRAANMSGRIVGNTTLSLTSRKPSGTPGKEVSDAFHSTFNRVCR